MPQAAVTSCAPTGQVPEGLAANFPRLRYMGSKYKLASHLERAFLDLGGSTFLDAFSGSGFVGYLAKSLGYSVVSNDHLSFPSVIARAAIVNDTVRLSDEAIARISGPAADDRDFIQRTFENVFFTAEDRAFLDSAWSHIHRMTGPERDLAIAALILSAARKQPRGVFTISGDLDHYNDGRRDLRLSLREHFRERALEYNSAVFASKGKKLALTGDVCDVPIDKFDVVYLDPPYAPPTDDADYTKRYHFLEGLSDYWQGREIMSWTKTKKLPKRHSLFANKKTIEGALESTFERFKDSGAIVLSYSSNALPGDLRIKELLGEVKSNIEVRVVPHTYHFGTHSAANRRSVVEYIFIGTD